MSFFSSLWSGVKSVGKSLLGSFGIGDALNLGGSAYGAYEQYKASQEANEANERIAAANREAAAAASQREYDRQKEFAQMGVRWKVDDAKAAGLHPLAAIGGTGASYSPIVVAGQDQPYRQPESRGVGNVLSAMGQNVARAQMATKTSEERELEALNLERARLSNRLLDAQITATWANVMGQPSNPPMASGAGVPAAPVAPVGAVQTRPSTQESRMKRDPGTAAAVPPAYKRYQLSDGTFIDVPTQEFSEGLEGAMPGMATSAWFRRNFDRYWNGYERPAAIPGHTWEWSPWSQSWSLRREGKSYPNTAGRRTGRPNDLYDHR